MTENLDMQDEIDDGNMRMICRTCAERRKGTITEAQVRESGFAKAAFHDGENTEHCWIAVTSVEDGVVKGTLDNKPVLVKNVKYQDKVEVKLSDVEEVLDDDYRNSL